MYVIFPADELIFMTYGAAVPRLQPRPTLDNLREPLVPSSSRPSSLNYSNPPPVDNQNQSVEFEPFSHERKISQDQQQQQQQPSIDYTDDLGNPFDSEYLPQYQQPQRSRSPSIFDSGLAPTPQRSPTPTASSLKSASSGKPDKKFRPRLHLPLGRLGKTAVVDATPETARLREDHQIYVSNPTFTRENLRQRNYDAFFESGKPVYSIEKRIQSRTTSETDLSLQPLPQNYLTPATPVAESNHKTVSFFTRSKTPTPANTPIGSTLTPTTPSSSSYNYSKNFENFDESFDKFSEAYQKESSQPQKPHRSIFGWKGGRKSPRKDPPKTMASPPGILKEYIHPNYNETLKLHNGVTFKLVKTVSDFTETLAQLYEQHAEALQLLVSNYRKKNGELRKERPACHSSLFSAWETFLQEIEADSQSTSDVASSLSRQVARPLLERSFYRKVQSRKVFTHRESFDTIIAKTEEKLSKCRLDYKQCYLGHRQNPNQMTLTQYIDSHNAYVQQLHATNAMLEAYHCETLPNLLQELEEIYTDLCNIVTEAVIQGAEAISNKAIEQSKRYEGLTSTCKSVSGPQDLTNVIRVLPITPNSVKIPRKMFVSPQPPPNPDSDEIPDFNDTTPIFKNELVVDRCASIQPKPMLEALKREAQDIEIQIRQLQDALDALARTQSRGLDSQLYNKANEIQEDISMKKFDLRAKQIHLAANRAQRELFSLTSKPEQLSSPRSERKLSSSSSSSMKTKWLKAFRSLKPASTNAPSDNTSIRPTTNQMYHAVSTVLTMRKNGAAAAAALAQIRAGDTESHNLQEYTYKKITPCDVCGQVLRGHTRQGLRCRICKTNAHADCASQLPRCQAKQKLLRRQKSTSEIENRNDPDEEREGPSLLSRHLSRDPSGLEPTNDVDQIYQVLKQAGEISSNKLGSNGVSQTTTMSSITATGISTATTTTTTTSTTTSIQQPDIPIVNVPEFIPDRTPKRGGQSKQQLHNSKNIGLAAPPLNDVSSSDYRFKVPSTITNTTTTTSTIVSTSTIDTGTRRRLFAGFRPLSGLGRLRLRSTQHRSISLPETPHSPRRHKLNLRMKSLSLDSPESSELHGQMRRRQQQQQQLQATMPGSSGYYGGSGGALEHSTPPSNNSRLHSPSSPSHQRKLLYATRGLKTGSVDLPDDIDKSLSSASISPCPSPVRQSQKQHRLLPTNLYVVLYNFKARHQDELDLKAGYKVTVIDTSDPDWWKGKCLGRVGYFPSKYVTRLAAAEKPLQVTLNLTVTDGERNESTMKLLRDQIVIQVGEEVSGMVMVRTADNRQGICPIKYLQEV